MKAIVKSTFVDIVDEWCKPENDSKRRSTEPRPQLRRLISTTIEGDDRPMYLCTGSNWVKLASYPRGVLRTIAKEVIGINDESDICRQETALNGDAAAISDGGPVASAFAQICEKTDEASLEIRQAPTGTTRVVVKSTFIDVVSEAIGHPSFRRASTDTPVALAEADDLYIHEGACWQKCVDVDGTSTRASKISLSEIASSVELDATWQTDEDGSNSDDESAQVGHTLTDGSVHAEERHKRPMRNRHATLPFALASGALQDAANQTLGIQGLPMSTDTIAPVVGTQLPISAHSMLTPGMCLWPWQCHLPAFVGYGASPEYMKMVGNCSSQSTSLEAPTLPEDRKESLERRRTTLMLRNLPNNYTRDLTIELLNTLGWAGRYDFLYYPVDFQTNSGLGFAFVNCSTHADACTVKAELEGFKKWTIPSVKVCTVGWCGDDQQGLAANIERYRNSSVMHKSVPDDRKPAIFKDGVRVKFPASTKKLWPPSRQYGSRAKK
jgi:hypothetical protein